MPGTVLSVLHRSVQLVLTDVGSWGVAWPAECIGGKGGLRPGGRGRWSSAKLATFPMPEGSDDEVRIYGFLHLRSLNNMKMFLSQSLRSRTRSQTRSQTRLRGSQDLYLQVCYGLAFTLCFLGLIRYLPSCLKEALKEKCV